MPNVTVSVVEKCASGCHVTLDIVCGTKTFRHQVDVQQYVANRADDDERNLYTLLDNIRTGMKLDGVNLNGLETWLQGRVFKI